MLSFAEMCWILGAAIFGVSEIRDLQSLGPVDRSKSLVKIPPLRLIRDLDRAEMPPCGLFFTSPYRSYRDPGYWKDLCLGFGLHLAVDFPFLLVIWTGC